MSGAPERTPAELDLEVQLAVYRYATRLQPASRRPDPAEMRRIFAGLGLTDPFWDPEARP